MGSCYLWSWSLRSTESSWDHLVKNKVNDAMGSQGVKWGNVIDVWQCLIWIASPVSIDRTSFSFKCRTTRKGSDFFGAEGFVVLKPPNFWKRNPKKIPVTKGCFGGRSLLRGIVSTIELQVRHGCLGQLGDLHFPFHVVKGCEIHIPSWLQSLCLDKSEKTKHCEAQGK